MAKAKRESTSEDEQDDAEAGLRAFWSGTITFGLVSVPVDFYASTRPRAGRLQLVTDEGEPVGRRYVCGKDHEVVSGDDIVRGYEVERGNFVVLTDEELEAAEPEKTRDIELQSFVAVSELPPLLFQRGYFLVPAGKSRKAYALLAETMQETAQAGLGTFVMRNKAYIVAILAEGGILRAETLRFADELRSPEGIGLKELEAPSKHSVERMKKAISALYADDLDLNELTDVHAERVDALARRKLQHNEDVVRQNDSEGPVQESGPTALELFELLKGRLGQTKATAEEPRRIAAPQNNDPSKREKAKSSLEHQTKSALYERAKELHIEGRSQMSKEDLVFAIERASDHR